MYLDTPYICTPLHLYASYIHTPPGMYTPICPPFSSVHLYVLRLLHVVGGCKGPPYMLDTSLTPPLYGVPPLQFTPPLICWLPCASVCFRDICMSYGDFSPYVGGLGCSPSVGVLGASVHEMSICSFLYILVVCYVSHFYYSYDYYSSSYGGIFLPVIGFIKALIHRMRCKFATISLQICIALG